MRRRSGVAPDTRDVMDGELCLDHVGDAILGAQPGVKRERHPIMDTIYIYIIYQHMSANASNFDSVC